MMAGVETAAMARCTGDPACPVRFRYGPPRRCRDHGGGEDDPGTVAGRLGVDLAAVPEGRHDGAAVTTRPGDHPRQLSRPAT